MKPSRLSLKALDLFVAITRTGSVQAAADQAGLSVSTVSHHLRQLETTLGTPLFDHTRRPLRVTPAGAGFQHDIEKALHLIAKAEAALHTGNLSETRQLGLAVIEDFDTEIAPELARLLTGAMPRCHFRHLTRPSHEILDLLRRQSIDIGIAARPQFDPPDLREAPLLRDPFVLALPVTRADAPEAFLDGDTGLPFLRYSANQIMASQIENQLRRLKRTLPDQYEFESNQTLMRLVAEGEGWAITTPMNYIRADRLHRQIRLAPFPGKGFARTLSLFTTDLTDVSVARTVTETLRRLIETRAVTPTVAAMPWLADIFRAFPVSVSEPAKST
ncbi:MAG: LysR family transcriptional regulator [Pseudomonadota bacterium]